MFLRLLAVAAVLLATPALADRRLALVLGSGGYEAKQSMPFADANRALMAETLRDIGFDVRAEPGRTRREIAEAVAAFGAEIEAQPEPPLVFVYIGGHVGSARGENYVLPSKADMFFADIDEILEVEGFPLERMFQRFGQAAVKAAIYVYDGSYDVGDGRRSSLGASRSLSVGRSLGTPGGARGHVTGGSTIIAHAQAPGAWSPSFDAGVDRPTLYTRILAEELRVRDRPLREAFRRASRRTIDESEGAQAPLVEDYLDQETVYLWPPSIPDIGNQKRFALVVGNGGYVEQALRNPQNDAVLIGDALAEVGFEVRTVINADKAALEAALTDFGDDIADAKEAGAGTVAFVYFAGHGVQSDGENFLLPVRHGVKRERHLATKAVKASEVLELLDDAQADLKFLVVDACRDNPLPKTIFRSAGGGSRGLARMGDAATSVRGTVIAYATAPGTVALDGAGENSPYAEALARHIVSRGLSSDTVFKRVRRDVLTATDELQIPWNETNMTDDFFFAANGN